MFETLFVRYHALSRHRNSPFFDERRSYLEHRAAQGAAKGTLKEIATYLLNVVEFLHLQTKEDQISVNEIKEAADLWVQRDARSSDVKDMVDAKRRFIKHAKAWLDFMGRLAKPVKEMPCYAGFVQQFNHYMRDERNLSPQSIDGRCRAIIDFFSHLGREIQSLEEITISDVDEALARKSLENGYIPTSLQSYASNLRVFVRYAEDLGWCRKGLADMIMAPRVYQHDSLPSAPNWEQVQQLLATTEGDDVADIRDRAIILLFAVYGLRCREVSLLRLDDLDWEQEVIHVYRPKQRKRQVYPLVYSVGESLLRYLKEVRPRSPSYRELFLTRRTPIQPMRGRNFYQIVARRMRSLDIKLDHYGPHSLRHACATRLLQKDFSLKEIGDHLGHKNPETTRIYAKVDLNGLRQVGNFDIGDIL